MDDMNADSFLLNPIRLIVKSTRITSKLNIKMNFDVFLSHHISIPFALYTYHGME